MFCSLSFNVPVRLGRQVISKSKKPYVIHSW